MTDSFTKPQNAKKTFRPTSSRAPRRLHTLALQMARAEEEQRAVGVRLKELRGPRTQQPIADAVGVTLRAYQAWEAGGGIAWENVRGLAKHFNVSENYILYGSNEGPGHREEQLDRVEAKLDRIEARVTALDEKLDTLLEFAVEREVLAAQPESKPARRRASGKHANTA